MSFNWNQLPLLRMLLPFAIGLLITKYWIDYHVIDTLIFGGVLLFFFLLLLLLDKVHFSKKWNNRFVFALLLQFLFIGLGILYSAQNLTIKKAVFIPQDLELNWIGSVLEVSEKEHKQTLLVQINRLYTEENAPKNSKNKALIYLADTTKIAVGDLLVGSAYFKEFQEALNPEQFDFREFNLNKYRYYYAFEDHVKIIDQQKSIFSLAAAFRNKIEQGFVKMGIQGDELAVLKALTLGDKSEINPELRSNYAAAGAMHILAVSGLHVGIIFLIFDQLLRFLTKKPIQRWLKAILLLFGIWSFALLTGLSPSVFRASLMFSFFILASAFKKDTNVINSLAASAFLLLLINPNMLFEVGFQLSYAAVLGIVLIFPKVYPLFKTKNKWLNKIIGLLIVSLAAQIATMPLSIYYFHQFPNWFLLTNLFAIPLAFAIVSGGFAVSVLWTLFENDFYLGELLYKTLQLLNYLVDFSALLPFSTTSGIWFLPISIFLFYASAAYFIAFLYANRKRNFLFCLGLILCVFTIEFVVDLNQLKKRKIGFYALKTEVVSVINGLDASVFVRDTSIDSFDKSIVEQHLNRLGSRRISWVYAHKDTIHHPLFQYVKNENMEYFKAFQYAVNFIDHTKRKYVNNANLLYFLNENGLDQLISEEKLAKKKLVFSFKVPPWSRKNQETTAKYGFHYLSRDGYFEIANL